MPSYPTFVRGLTFFAAFLIVFASLFAFTFTVEFVGKLSECDNDACDQMRMTAIESSMGSFAIHFFLIAVSALVVAAELHLSFVAWYFGFMAFRFGRGLSLIICGFVAFSYSRAFVKALERSEHAPRDASLFVLAAGITASIIGLMNLVISVLPQCCTRSRRSRGRRRASISAASAAAPPPPPTPPSSVAADCSASRCPTAWATATSSDVTSR